MDNEVSPDLFAPNLGDGYECSKASIGASFFSYFGSQANLEDIERWEKKISKSSKIKLPDVGTNVMFKKYYVEINSIFSLDDRALIWPNLR